MRNLHGNTTTPRVAKVAAVLALGAATAAGLASCGVLRGTITGSGVAESISYDFDAIDELEVTSTFNADITIEQGPPSVEIIIDDDLAQHLDVQMRNGRLEVGMESGSYRFRVGPELIVTTQHLERLDLSGASDTTLTGLDADEFELRISGASSAEIEGDADVLKIDLSGASSVEVDGASNMIELEASGASSADLVRLGADSVDVDMSGASNAELGDVGSVTGEISGASNLEVNDDTDTSVDTSGASTVERR